MAVFVGYELAGQRNSGKCGESYSFWLLTRSFLA